MTLTSCFSSLSLGKKKTIYLLKIVPGTREMAALPSRGPSFNSQHPHASSEPSVTVTPVPRDLTPSSVLCWHQAQMRTDIHARKHSYTLKSLCI